MVSLFGTRSFDTPGLVGRFYDLKQSATKKNLGTNNEVYLKNVATFFAKGWDDNWLAKNFFTAPNRLSISQFLIPYMPAASAPASFEVKVAPSKWIAHYKGSVKAPFTGKFRFVAVADDWIYVRWNKKNVVGHMHSRDATGYLPRSAQGNPYGTGKRHPDTLQRSSAGIGGQAFAYGEWIDVKEGEYYPIEVAIGETPGGIFWAFLAYELKNERGKLCLFRMSRGVLDLAAFEEQARKLGGTGGVAARIDYSGGKYIWEPKMNSGFQGKR